MHARAIDLRLDVREVDVELVVSRGLRGVRPVDIGRAVEVVRIVAIDEGAERDLTLSPRTVFFVESAFCARSPAGSTSKRELTHDVTCAVRRVISKLGQAAGRLNEESRARLSSSTLTRGSPKKPNCRPSRVIRDERLTALTLTPRARATRATCCAAVAGEISGSSPEPDEVTMSDGHLPAHRRVLCNGAVDRLRDERVRELAIRRALVGAGRRGVIVAVARGRRARMEVLAPGERSGRSARCPTPGHSPSR